MHRLIHSFLCIFFLLVPCAALAGSGTVHNNGDIDFTAKFTYPPTQDDIDSLMDAILEASDIICDVTDGQMRFGTVTIVGGTTVGTEEADLLIWPENKRSNSSVCAEPFCYALAQTGKHINLYHDDIQAWVIAHEFGHLALNLADEYDEQDYFGCYGAGNCIDCEDVSPTNTCLMQQGSCNLTDWSELCVASNHDPLQGDPLTPMCTDPNTLTCPPPACPGNGGCQLWNPTTCRYEMTSQTAVSISQTGIVQDCWSWIEQVHPFLTKPANTPEAVPPACAQPTLIDLTDADDQIMLVLDRSWSMFFSATSGQCAGPGCPEICNNGVDDDLDGNIDEGGCETSRLEFMQAAARAFLNLHKATSPPWIAPLVGLEGFNCTPTMLTEGLVKITSGSYNTTFRPEIDGINPNGNTAIGDALAFAGAQFPGGDQASPNKAILLISDGWQNCGTKTPQEAVDELAAQDVNVYFMTTGSASNDEAIGQMASQTNGKQIHTPKTAELVTSSVQQWANHKNAGLQIPKLQYKVLDTSPYKDSKPRTGNHWFQNQLQAPSAGTSGLAYKNNLFQIEVEPGTTRLVVSLAGDLTTMKNFGVRGVLTGPAGPNPNLHDSAAALHHPTFTVEHDSFFKLLLLENPNPGTWKLEVTSAGPLGLTQSGYVTAALENVNSSLVVDLDRHLVASQNEGPVKLTILPRYHGDLRGVGLTAKVKWPDGTWHNLTIDDHSDRNAGYTADISGFPLVGNYEVRVWMNSISGVTSNNPGENLSDNDPPNTVAIPRLSRSGNTFFYVKSGRTTPGR